MRLRGQIIGDASVVAPATTIEHELSKKLLNHRYTSFFCNHGERERGDGKRERNDKSCPTSTAYKKNTMKNTKCSILVRKVRKFFVSFRKYLKV